MKKLLAMLGIGLGFITSVHAALSSASYAKNGLIGQWDGLENAGVGIHDAAATTWKNLAGTAIGDFTITTGVASFTESGLKKNAAGIMAKVARPSETIRTVEVVLSGIPETGWVNAFFMNHPKGNNITVTVRNGETATGPRQYFYDVKGHGWTTTEKPATQTLAAIFAADAANLKDDSSLFCNGVRPSGERYTNSWGNSAENDIQLGGRANFTGSGDYKTSGYTIHAIRVYNRELTAGELNYHAKVDQARFFGRPQVDDTLPTYITDGLIGLWDGIENAGAGVHDPAATVWKDLTGNGGDFILEPNSAAFTVNGLKKTGGPTLCATNVVNHTGVLTLEGAVSGANHVSTTESNVNQWINLIYLNKNQTLTMRNKAAGSEFFFDYEHLKWTMPDTWDAFTMTARYGQMGDTIQGSSFLLNAAPPATGNVPSWTGLYWGANDRESLGGRYNAKGSSDAKVYGYTIHGLRMYNRVLSDAEVKYNTAVDERRYRGGRPEGFAYRLVEGAVQCQLRAWTDECGGSVKIGSGADARSVATDWVALETEQTATFTATPEDGWAFAGWAGDVASIVSGSPSDRTITVRSTAGAALQARFTETIGKYVQNGLVGFWDAKENAGFGHHDATATTWTDLTGLTGDFTIDPSVASFTEAGFKKYAKGVMAQAARPGRAIRSIEVVVSEAPSSGWMNAVFITKDQHVNVNNNGSSARQYFFDYQKKKAMTAEKPMQETIAVVFNEARTAADTAYSNGQPLTLEASTSYWGQPSETAMTLGGRLGSSFTGSGDCMTFGYTIHAVRFYDRVLTAGEVARNARRDAVRYFGLKPGGLVLILR